MRSLYLFSIIMKVKDIFGKTNKIIIGAIHLPPLPGYKDWPGLEVARTNALKDLRAFVRGRVDGIIFENNYDIPHTELIKPAGLAAMNRLGKEIRKICPKPLGVNVLWNDYISDFKLAKDLDLQFVRIPVFVDKVKTDYGIITGYAKKITASRKKMGLNNKTAIFTDIHVKHSVLISEMSLVESGRKAIRQGSDSLILTGQWTGQAPDLRELRSLRKAIGNFPIFIGSGANRSNIKRLLNYANGVIVSTSLKRGGTSNNEVNLKGYAQRIDLGKTLALVRAAGSTPGN